jgi:D-glycero-D-manno-heptose 1,7-bisphosphate phosphatase
MARAVFLDRDGVINQKPLEGQYVTSWEEFHFLPKVAEAIALLNRAGFSVIVITNQRCIAKGLVTVPGLERMHRQMCETLARAGATVDEVYYCPHEAESSCACRKPAPGMLLEAARTHYIELGASWMVGDSDIDVQAGRYAGCKTVRISTAKEIGDGPESAQPFENSADIVAPSLLDAVGQILHRDGVCVDSRARAREAT